MAVVTAIEFRDPFAVVIYVKTGYLSCMHRRTISPD